MTPGVPMLGPSYESARYFRVRLNATYANRHDAEHGRAMPVLCHAPISMRRGIALVCFGMVIVRTPFLPAALTFSLSTVSGNRKRR